MLGNQKNVLNCFLGPLPRDTASVLDCDTCETFLLLERTVGICSVGVAERYNIIQQEDWANRRSFHASAKPTNRDAEQKTQALNTLSVESRNQFLHTYG